MCCVCALLTSAGSYKQSSNGHAVLLSFRCFQRGLLSHTSSNNLLAHTCCTVLWHCLAGAPKNHKAKGGSFIAILWCTPMPDAPHTLPALQAPDAGGAFRFVLLDEGGVTSKSGARLYTSRATFLAELARIEEPREGVKGLGKDAGDEGGAKTGNPAGEDHPADSEDPPPAAAVVM